MRKPYRKGLKAMDKPATSFKNRTHFWYIAMVSFLLWIFLLYLFNSSAVTVHNHERLFREEETTNVAVSDQRSDDSVSAVSHDEKSGEEDHDISLPVSGDSGNDQTSSDDAKAVNEIVEELEKKKTEVDDDDDNDRDLIMSQKDPPIKENFEAKNGVDELLKGLSNKRESKRSSDSDGYDDEKGGAQVILKKSVNVRPRKTYPNDPCTGKYIYMHEIPQMFNEELLKNCKTLSPWTDMCELTSNLGLGPRLSDMERVSGWFATNQFTLEVIFHNRMKQYKCLTKDSSLASAVFVPYYAGLDVMRFLWEPFPYMRDAAALDLMKWLRERLEWKRMNGRDHFMVAGRTTWDFMRTPGNDSDWGNRLMILPEPRNMTMLLIESSPWNYHGFAIPYPTYFHPSTRLEILQWQNRMRRIKRRYLFSFVGAPRPNLGDSIRGEIMDQCRSSRRKCKLLECVSGSQKCYKPDQIMKFFLSSTFCLQPPGDSFTRRSTFDSILAGCIPVFFHPGSAYAQYIWHFPRDFRRFSVFIPIREVKEGRVSIERVLNKIPRAKVVAMREEVIKLITRVTYFDPKKRVEGFEDAFDVTVTGVLERVEAMRRRMEEGREEMFDFPEDLSWKYNMFGNVAGSHEWDSYFDRP